VHAYWSAQVTLRRGRERSQFVLSGVSTISGEIRGLGRTNSRRPEAKTHGKFFGNNLAIRAFIAKDNFIWRDFFYACIRVHVYMVPLKPLLYKC
jgi:hypothetical protein